MAPGCNTIFLIKEIKIAMKEFNSALIQKERLLPGIHGLRGVTALGIVLFHLHHLTGINPPAALMFLDLRKFLKNDGRWDIVAWGLSLAALCIWQSLRPSFAIANKPFEYLGEQSFSIYLIHPTPITFLKDYLIRSYDALLPHLGTYAFFVCAALIIGTTLIFAEFTYKFIEVPGIRLGRQLIAGSAQT